jgi:selenide,water dikinase
MIAPLLAGRSANVLVGPETGDDAGVYLHDGSALVATVDFITPVCDDPRRFGRIAAANSVSDVYAMGGKPLFALNVCCFPQDLPREVPGEILRGASDVLRETGTALLGGHTVQDKELKFGLSVVGHVDPRRILANAGARAGQRLILTKALGTGVLINGFKRDKVDAATLEPALVQMERVNAAACEAGLRHGATACTDITGFGFARHALGIARASKVGLRVDFDRLPVLDGFRDAVAAGVTTGTTAANRKSAEDRLQLRRNLSAAEQELLFDPQTSGGLLLCVPESGAAALLAALAATDPRSADVGEAISGEPRLIVD